MSIVVLNTLRGMIESGAELDKTTAAILLLAAAQFATADALWVWLLAKLYSKLFRIRASLVKEREYKVHDSKPVFTKYSNDYTDKIHKKIRVLELIRNAFLGLLCGMLFMFLLRNLG